MGEAREGLQQRHDPRIPEAQSGRALPGFEGGMLEPIEGVLGQDAFMTHAFDVEERVIDLVTELPETAKVVEPFRHVEVFRVVDGRLGS